MYFISPPTNNPLISDQGSRYRETFERKDFGVLTSSGRPIEASFHYRSNKIYTNSKSLEENFFRSNNQERLKGRWLYGGVIFAHFGHFLTESVHRLVHFLDDEENFDGVIFQKAPFRGESNFSINHHKFIAEVIFDYFRVPKEKVFFVQNDLLIDDVVFYPQAHQLGKAPSNQYLARLKLVEDTYFGLRGSNCQKNDLQSIFISRKNYLHMGRTLGMRSLENVFLSNHFSIITPEDFTIFQQMEHIREASHIIAEAGSAMHILDVLGPQTARLSLISRRGKDAKYWETVFSGRVEKMDVFEDVLPISLYTGNTPGNGHSLIFPSQMISFLRRLGINFNEEQFLDDLKNETHADMKRMNLCLP